MIPLHYRNLTIRLSPVLQIQSKICVITSQTLHLLYSFPFSGCPISLDWQLFPSVAFVTVLTLFHKEFEPFPFLTAMPILLSLLVHLTERRILPLFWPLGFSLNEKANKHAKLYKKVGCQCSGEIMTFHVCNPNFWGSVQVGKPPVARAVAMLNFTLTLPVTLWKRLSSF